MTIIEGVDVTQNTNINNKLSLTGAPNQTVSGNVTISQDLIVSGNLIITGNIGSQNVQQLAVSDPLIVLGIGNYTSDTKDIGFAAHYNDGVVNAHSGIIRDSGTKEYYVFKGYTPEVDVTNNVDINDASFAKANLNAGYFKGNLIATTAVVNGLDISSVWTTQNTRMVIIENTDLSQNSRIDYSNTAITIIQGTDVGQNTRLTVIENTDLSQNARLDYSNTAITIIQGTDVGQNARMTVIEGTNASQNVRIDYSNTAISIIQNTDISQNSRIDYSNTAITIIQGTDVGQNARMTVIEGTNASQNVRIDYSNTAITIIQGVDLGQNTAIAATDGKMQSAYNQANVTVGALNSANANIILLQVLANTALPNVGAVITVNTSSRLYISNTQASTSKTTGALQVEGGVGVTGDVWADNVYANNLFSANYPIVLSDITNQFDGAKCVFNLIVDQSNVTSIMDSKNLEVVIDGVRLSPYVKDLRYPWITPYDSYKGFKVSTQNTASNTTQTLTIYNAPDIGVQASITIINSSSSPQTKKYPYSADTIALGD